MVKYSRLNTCSCPNHWWGNQRLNLIYFQTLLGKIFSNVLPMFLEITELETNFFSGTLRTSRFVVVIQSLDTNGQVRWSSRSLDLTPSDVYFLDISKDEIHKTRSENVNDLERNGIRVMNNINRKTIHEAAKCIDEEGNIFEHIIWLYIIYRYLILF